MCIRDSWRNDQRAGGSVKLRDVGIIEDAIEKRYTEAVGLSHAGAGLTNEVLAIESDGERELLDGEGVRNPVVSEGIADLYSDAEFGKGRGFAGIAGRFRGKHTLIVEDVAIVGPLERRSTGAKTRLFGRTLKNYRRSMHSMDIKFGFADTARELVIHAEGDQEELTKTCLLYTSPSPRDLSTSRMPSSA